MRDSRTVLVIESDESLSSLLRRLIERESLGVELLPHDSSAVQLVKKLECRSYAAIVVQVSPIGSPIDPSLPTGIALLQVIAKVSPECLTKTIVLTTFENDRIVDLESTCRVLREPFEIDEFAHILRSCATWGSSPSSTSRGQLFSVL